MEPKLDGCLESILIPRESIAKRVREAAAWLDGRFAGAHPLAVCVLKGSIMFFCDLVREMNTDVQLDFMDVSSYGAGTESSGRLIIESDLAADVSGRDVIVVEDVVDSGNTLFFLRKHLIERGAKSVTLVTLLDKPDKRRAPVEADFSCFELGDGFVVGYGLDYDQRFRNLPYVALLKSEIYKK